ncbi:uncharacterized protein BO97DRAFT_425088 [Aspergillus homomorphus CBS 101889]|uniref:Uncharacterized protein n=1 Tax=Aspergillus homomorphus (strain CBS 101889) TaxID=1450537 RepID=A0A395HW86_ASPHC|nr:hypothetical protein BO97DRAFT_425088 [Aspergillus homomorphus CBS 101889]RAL11789.1 hypothetical protein BO97DRAFT_425088 [Aspergillus homomorphus CBS 101889]
MSSNADDNARGNDQGHSDGRNSVALGGNYSIFGFQIDTFTYVSWGPVAHRQTSSHAGNASSVSGKGTTPSNSTTGSNPSTGNSRQSASGKKTAIGREPPMVDCFRPYDYDRARG